MNLIKKFITLSFILILLQSCLIVSNLYQGSTKSLTKNNNDHLGNTKILIPSGKFIDIKNSKAEIYFIDDIKPQGHIIIIDSLDQDSIVKMIIVNDSIVKN